MHVHLLLVHEHHQEKNLVQIYGIYFAKIEIILEKKNQNVKLICSELLSGGSNSGTSHLKRHNE